jgi:hypothetical protein
MSEEWIKLGDLAYGICPYCKCTTTFVPTSKKLIYFCDTCEKDVKQYKNGKIHWHKIDEPRLKSQIKI